MKHSRLTTHALKNKAALIIALFIFFHLNNFAQVANWKVNGNSITSSDFIGTTNNEDFTIKTNGATAVKVKANGNFILKSLESLGAGLVQFDNNGKVLPLVFSGNTSQVLLGDGTFGSVPNSFWIAGSSGKIYYNGGKVGIGTATPNYKLDVDGNVRITKNLLLEGALVINDSVTVDSTKGFYGVSKFNGDVKLKFKLNVDGDAVINGNTQVNGALTTPVINVGQLNANNFGVSGDLNANRILASRITSIPGDSVFIIGDSSMFYPAGTNTMYGNASGTSQRGTGIGFLTFPIGQWSLSLGHNSKTLAPSSISMGYRVGTGTSAQYAITIGSGSSTTNLINPNSNSLWVGFNSDQPTLVVTPSTGPSNTGAVAIGTTDVPSGYKLAVYGKIIAEELKIKLKSAGWPDYVFAKDYKLLPLSEVESYINKNQHLPGIPCAKEMEENGLNTSEMIIQLMKKQEELTLYIIQQNKRIEQLEKLTKH